MTLFLCKLWPYLAGGLIGWLLAGWLAKRLKHGEPPVEKIVEKHIDRVVDNPEHLSLISKLESENKKIPDLQSRVASFESATNNSGDVRVETVEKRVEVDNPEHLKKISQLEAEIRALKSSGSTASSSNSSANTSTYGVASSTGASQAAPSSSSSSDKNSSSSSSSQGSKAQGSTADIDAAKKAGFRLKQINGQDDFTVVEGIGPKINELIHNEDIHYFAALASTSVDQIQKILDDAGSRYKLAKPGTWPKQAQLAADNKWEALKKWQDELDGGQ